MPLGDLLGIGSSALLTYQRSLSTVSHNIANVNTDGYSRQRVESSTRLPQASGNGFVGTGVKVDSVERMYNSFLNQEIHAHTAGYRELDTLQLMAGRLDNMLADEHAGLSPVLSDFFNAVQGVADDPTSTAARQVLISEANTVAARFHDLDGWLRASRTEVNARMGGAVDEINRLTGAIASINEEIVTAQGAAGGQPPNDLLDQRNLLVRELAQLVSVSTVDQDNGALNVFMGSGQVLVLGATAGTLGVQSLAEDPAQVEITLGAGGSNSIPVTSLVSGGELGGLLKYRDQVLDPAHNALGRVAVEFGTFMNEQHRRGMTLDGKLGQDLFSVGSPQVATAPGTVGSITVGFDDVAALARDDYRLRYDGGSWTLSRAGSGQAVALSGSGTPADPFVAEGLSIVIGGGAAAGDSFLIRPTRKGAAAIGVAITDPRDLALALPFRTAAALGNSGTGIVSNSSVTDIENPAFQSVPGNLTPSVMVRFTSPASYEVIDRSTLTTIDTGSYDPSQGADIFPTANLGIDFGYRMHISGSPAAGDEFTLEYNTDGVGDNRNALLLSNLQSARLMDNGTTSFNDAYGQLVADVGTRVRQAQVNSQTQKSMLEQSQAAYDSVSGVNLDEEAADLLRFQQAYQAAAQVIAVADQIFATLIDAVRR
jgi:flagellar hook-associated protein 1 FlgK